METEQEHEDGTLSKRLWFVCLFVCLFVMYRYVCIDVIITNSTIAYCLQSYLVLHRLL